MNEIPSATVIEYVATIVDDEAAMQRMMKRH